MCIYITYIYIYIYIKNLSFQKLLYSLENKTFPRKSIIGIENMFLSETMSASTTT